MAKLAEEKAMIAHTAQLLELLIIVYREKSGGGESLQEGLEHVNHPASFYLEIERLLGVNISFHPASELEITRASSSRAQYQLAARIGLLLQHPSRVTSGHRVPESMGGSVRGGHQRIERTCNNR